MLVHSGSLRSDAGRVANVIDYIQVRKKTLSKLRRYGTLSTPVVASLLLDVLNLDVSDRALAKRMVARIRGCFEDPLLADVPFGMLPRFFLP